MAVKLADLAKTLWPIVEFLPLWLNDQKVAVPQGRQL